MKHLAFSVALIASPLLAAAPAQALPVVNTYQIVSRFATGPIALVTQQVTLAFDPSVSSTGSVLSYSSSIADPSFNPAGGVQYGLGTSSSMLTDTSTLTFGGAINGPSSPVAGTFDFQNIFFVAPSNGAIRGGVPLIPFSADTRYTTATGFAETFDVTVSLISSAVPEPSAWAMMIVGLGLVGATMRVRRRSIAFA